MFVLVIGPAASGKTSISNQLSKNGFLINLDPATSSNAPIDIRKWVKVEDIQKKYNLGINGALLKSMEIISGINEWIYEDRNKIKIVDTPGQLEIFLYHEYGKKIVEKMLKHDIVTSLFIIDAQEILSLENYLAILAQNAMINLKLMIPSITAINKIDVVDVERIKKFIDRKNIEKEFERGDALISLSKGLIDYVEYTSIYQRPIFVSAKTGEGIYDLYSVIHEVHCSCGDLS
ncbi:MAG TPA: GTPase [Thermoplasmatales archaeon]|nr:GTPase [Thermoplasmatales archaeon]